MLYDTISTCSHYNVSSLWQYKFVQIFRYSTYELFHTIKFHE